MSNAKADRISAKELSEITGLTDRRHRQLATEGFFPPPARGEYHLKKTFVGIARYYREQLHKKGDSVAAERKAYARARRIKVEKETAILDGEYVKREEVGPILKNLALHQRAALQNKLENELSIKLAGLDPIEIRRRMAEAVDELCRMFQSATSKWTDPPATP